MVILKNFKGYLSTDGYSAYDIFEQSKLVKRPCCWAHARRKSRESRQNDPVRGEYALAQIQKLYAIERKDKEDGLSFDQICKLRLKEAVPLLDELKKWLIENYKMLLPSSVVGKRLPTILANGRN